MTMMCVFDRMMSRLADVNTQSTVGMFHFHDVLYCSFCTTYSAKNCKFCISSICRDFLIYITFRL